MHPDPNKRYFQFLVLSFLLCLPDSIAAYATWYIPQRVPPSFPAVAVSCAVSSWLSPARSSSPGAATRTPFLSSVGFYVESGCEDDFRTVTGSAWGIRRCCSIAMPPCKRSVGCL